MRFCRLSLPLVLIATLCVTGWALPHQRPANSPVQSAIEDHSAWINVNELLMFVGNNGTVAYDQAMFFGRQPGLYFPYVSLDSIVNGYQTQTAIYAAGLWLGAVDSATGDTLIALTDYSTEYYPGPMIGHSYDPNAESDPAVRAYRLYSDSLAGSPNSDYTNWPLLQGAPLTRDGTPEIIGDQTIWSVFNDANAAQHGNDAGLTEPLGLEVSQSVFGFNDYGELGHTVYVRYRLYNRGLRTLTGLHVSLWVDPDVGSADDDYVGCDTTLNLGFAYNATNVDGIYGNRPPAVGVSLIQGPAIYSGDLADTAFTFGRRLPGYRNCPMSSFIKYVNGTDPEDYTQTYRYLKGLTADGTPYMYNGQALKYMVSGNPAGYSGDLDYAPSDRRMMPTTGPITLRPGDSTELVWGIVVEQAGDRLSSLSIVKYYVANIREFYYAWMKSCCIESTGNVDGDFAEIVDISDLMAMVDYLFLEGTLSPCPEENNVDLNPSIDIGDLMALVDYLFFEYPLPACP